MIFGINLDMDNVTKEEILTYLKLIQKLAKRRATLILYKQSPSKKGYHIHIDLQIPDQIIDTLDLNSFKLGLRYFLLDCFGRWKADLARLSMGEHMDNLSVYKDGKYSGEWVKYE